MSIGTTHPVKLIEIVQTTGSQRNTVESDGNTYSLFAEIKRIGGARDFSRGQTQLEEGLSFKVRFRFNYKPDAKYKILYNGHRHTVKSIERDKEKNFYWIIKADSKHG